MQNEGAWGEAAGAGEKSTVPREQTAEERELQRCLSELERLQAQGGRICADGRGLITEVNVKAGDKTTGSGDIRYADASQGVLITARFKEEEREYLNKKSRISLEGENGVSISGLKIKSIAADREAPGEYLVTAEVSEKKLKIGSMVEMKVESGDTLYNACIPREALHQGEKGAYYVYVLKEEEGLTGKQLIAIRREVSVADKNEEFAALEDMEGDQEVSKQVCGLYQNKEYAPTAAEIFEKQRKGDVGLSAIWWQKKGKDTVICRDTGGTASAEILAICGRSDLLFPGTVSLDYDQNGFCLLGRETAVSLFGSGDAAGLQVEYGGSLYQVKGIISDVGDVFLYEARREDTLMFSRLTAACDDRAGQAIIKTKMENRFAPDEFLDYAFFDFAAELFLMVLPVAQAEGFFGCTGKLEKGKPAGGGCFFQQQGA
ncbi:MAG: hypothetical protein HFE76_13655 [Firmicutes bacterium]|nr:hypothetical protein [Bacillota bacterium]